MNENGEAKLLALMEALFNGQKRTLGMVEAAIEKFSTVETEIIKLNRKVNGLQELALRQQSETSGRLDAVSAQMGLLDDRLDNLNELALRHQRETSGRLEAISARFEETEKLLDDRAGDITRIQIDVVGQYNEVLTALRDASHAFRIAEEVSARLTEAERRIAHL